MRHPSPVPRAVLNLLVGASLALAPMAARADTAPAISLIRDTEIETILHQDADPIFTAAGLDPKSVKIYIISDKELNAFSAGGQQLFLNTGLILETKDPNQLIGVIAHETGHIAGGHLARSGGFTKAAMGPMLLSVGLGILAALAGQPGAAAGLIFSSGYFGEISALGYSREQEFAGRPGGGDLPRDGRACRAADWSASSTTSATRRCSTTRRNTPSSATTP